MIYCEYEKIENFIHYVIDWNQVLDTDISEKKLALQTKITLSEVQETIDSILENNEREMIDGVGDILVTAGYMIYLQNEGSCDFLNETHTGFRFECPASNELLYDMVREIKSEVETHTVDYFSLRELAAAAISRFGESTISDYFDRILLSNDSKFIKKSDWDEPTELNHANKKYQGEFSNITAVAGTFRGNDIFMLRADGGVGKILKPTGFVEPEDVVI